MPLQVRREEEGLAADRTEMFLLQDPDRLLAISVDCSPVPLQVPSQPEGLVTVRTAEESFLLMLGVHVPGEVSLQGEGEPAGLALMRATSLVDSPLVTAKAAGSGEGLATPLLGAGVALPQVG